jgi:hypothetical protein
MTTTTIPTTAVREPRTLLQRLDDADRDALCASTWPARRWAALRFVALWVAGAVAYGPAWVLRYTLAHLPVALLLVATGVMATVLGFWLRA